MRINAIIEEIKELKNERNHCSALKIVSLLENNQKLFLAAMDASDLNFMLRNFEELSQTQPKDYNSAAFKSDYEKHFESLLFHFNRIS